MVPISQPTFKKKILAKIETQPQPPPAQKNENARICNISHGSFKNFLAEHQKLTVGGWTEAPSFVLRHCM